MPAALCLSGDNRPAIWNQFCATCKSEMGVEWRLRITSAKRNGVAFRWISEAAKAIQMHRASCRVFGGGRPR